MGVRGHGAERRHSAERRHRASDTSPEETDTGQKTHHKDGRSPEQRGGAGSLFPVQGEEAASGALGQLTGGLSPAVSLNLSLPL